MQLFRMEAVVTGVVQGVGFRFFAQFEAVSLDLTGTVQNQPDGRVRIVAVGPEETLKKYLTIIKTGPDLGRVDKVDVRFTPVETQPPASFEILTD